MLLRTPSPNPIKCAAALPCNLSLRAHFADINVSQHNARCGGIFNILLAANLRRNLSVKKLSRLRFDRIIVMSLWPRFFGPPCKPLDEDDKCRIAYVHCVSEKKQDTKLLPITSRNINRFSKFFHW